MLDHFPVIGFPYFRETDGIVVVRYVRQIGQVQQRTDVPLGTPEELREHGREDILERVRNKDMMERLAEPDSEAVKELLASMSREQVLAYKATVSQQSKAFGACMARLRELAKEAKEPEETEIEPEETETVEI
jgi:hypothetical protein